MAPVEPAVRDRLAARAGRRSSGSTRPEPRGLRQPLVHRVPARRRHLDLRAHVADQRGLVRGCFVASFGLVWMCEAAARTRLRAVEPGLPDARRSSCCRTRCTRRSTGCGCCRSSRSAASDLQTFVAFEVADVAVFVTRFSFFGELGGYGGLPFGAFEIAIAARTARPGVGGGRVGPPPDDRSPGAGGDLRRHAGRGCAGAGVSDGRRPRPATAPRWRCGLACSRSWRADRPHRALGDRDRA